MLSLKRETPKPIIIATASLLALTMSACAFQKDPKSAENSKINDLEKQLDANRPIDASEFTQVFIAGVEPNSYTARVSLPRSRPLNYVVTLPSGAVRSFDGRDANEFDLACVQQRVRYDVEVIHPSGKTTNTFTINNPCPLDYEVKGVETNIAALNKANGRLILRNSSQIVVTNEALHLNVNEIFIEGSADLETFSRDRSGSWQNDRFNVRPPNISIRAKAARGALRIWLNGIDAPHVKNLVDTSDSNLDGEPGSKAEIQIDTRTSGRPGSASETEKTTIKCLKRPGDGKPGKSMSHVDGQKGWSGLPGVGTSAVSIEIADTSKFALDINLNPGLSSRPGKGSKFVGGRGGPAGENPHEACPPARAGENGKDSKVGPDGDEVPHPKCGNIDLSSSLFGKVRIVDRNLNCSADPNLIQKR